MSDPNPLTLTACPRCGDHITSTYGVWGQVWGALVHCAGSEEREPCGWSVLKPDGAQS